MITLAEKMASLSPEHRARVEGRAEELIAQERARRAKQGSKRSLARVNSLRIHASAKPCYGRKAAKFTMGKRSFRRIRRAPGRRLRGAGYRRCFSAAR